MGDVMQAERVLDDDVGFGFALRHVALRVVPRRGDVVGMPRVHDRRARRKRGRDVGDSRQILVLDFDQRERRLGDFDAVGRNRGDFVAQAPHLVALERHVILGDDAERTLVGHVGRGEHRTHARQRFRALRVDAHDPRVDPRAAQDLRVELAGEIQIVQVARLAARLVRRVELGDPLADQRAFLDDGSRRCHHSLVAAAIASTILT